MIEDLLGLEAFGMKLCALAASVSVPLFRHLQDDPINKEKSGAFDPVTEADKRAELVIRQAIRSHFPHHGIIGEEFGVENDTADYVWVLDPIDGTRAFISGVPLWTTLIGLRYQNTHLMGFVSQPILGEIYLGSPNGSRLITANLQTPLRVKKSVSLSHATAMTTDPYLFQGQEALGFERLRQKVRLMRYSADAYAFALLAAGQIDMALDTGLKSWDMDALVPLITHAGGVCCDWEGGPVSMNGGALLATSSQALMDEALTLLSPEKAIS